jgi:hypothetical protein
MPAVFGNVGASAGEVNDFHSNSDVDKSTLSQHHTLGIQPNQASPGDHTHDGRNSRRIQTDDLVTPDISYQPQGDALITSPTFDGDPLITGSYTKIGSLVYFEIAVDFSNILTFGAGQYYVTLPFTSAHAVHFREGCLHDFSGNDQYSISGHVAAGSQNLYLFSVASNGRDVPFTHSVPVNLAVEDNFHIAGTYQIQS